VPLIKKYSGIDHTQDKQECLVSLHARRSILYACEHAWASKDRWDAALSLCSMLQARATIPCGFEIETYEDINPSTINQ
jgi:hypothetical protein